MKTKTRFFRVFLVISFSVLFIYLLHIKNISLHGFYDTDSVQPEVVYKHRKSIVNFICAQKNRTNATLPLDRNVAARLYVEHSHKFIYCEVPKVGCSNWKRVMLLLDKSLGFTLNELKNIDVHTLPLLRKLSSYSLAKQKELLSNYTKVMFTRHPLERLVSAYRDKFYHDNIYYGKTIANMIKRRLKLNGTEKLTFKQFVDFIVIENPLLRDIHWKPMYELCDPCKINYDIIGRYETLNQDVDFVLKTIRTPENIKYPSTKHYANDSRTNKEISKPYLETLSPDLLTKLLNVYSVDFSMFEYDQYKISTARKIQEG